jgi:mannose-6-phosphate isomerase-like protein (cupin superfamily)
MGGASEGVHTHKPQDASLGSFDEFYYIVSGSGEMQIDGQKVPVRPGDHVFTPNGPWRPLRLPPPAAGQTPPPGSSGTGR